MSQVSHSVRGISAAAIMAILAGASYAELPEALKATKSQGFDNQSAVSAVLGGTVLGYSGDAGAYLRARENAANYATTLGGGGMYSGDQLLNPTADWSIAVSAKLATDKANGIIWSTGRAALASGIKKGLALLEKDDGSVKLVHWVVGQDAEVILSGEVTDGTTRYHSYIVTHAYTAATEEPESAAQSTYTLYIDGVQAATATGAAYECDENGFQFGRVHGAIPTGATEGVGIMLDEVGVWTDKVLSAEDAKSVADELPVWPGAIGEITLPAGEVNWSNVEKPETLGDSNEITLQGDTTLTLGGAVDLKNVVLKGTGTLLIADPENLTIGGLEKAAGTDFGFVIDATAGVTADEAIKGYIQNTNYKLVIKGSGEGEEAKGLTVDFGQTANFVINSHLVFEGGKHTFKYGRNAGGDFGGGASDTNPTILITDGTTLDLVGKDLTGWDGAYNANGVIRVNDGGTLNFQNYGNNTIYYRQRLVIEPGATVTAPKDTNKIKLRLYGGASGDTIFVPANGGEKVATLSGHIGLFKDGTTGFGINVGSGSKLQLDGMLVQGDSKNYQFAKRGDGTLSGLKIDGNTTITTLWNADGLDVLSGTTVINQTHNTAERNNSRGLIGTTTVAKNATLKLACNDAINYSGTTVTDIKGTLDLGVNRQTVFASNTIKIHPGATITGTMPAAADGDTPAVTVDGGCHLNQFQNSSIQMVSEEGDEGTEATIGAIIGPQGTPVFALNVAQGLTLNLTATSSSTGAGRQQGINKTGKGTLKLASDANISSLASLTVTDGVIVVPEDAQIPTTFTYEVYAVLSNGKAYGVSSAACVQAEANWAGKLVFTGANITGANDFGRNTSLYGNASVLEITENAVVHGYFAGTSAMRATSKLVIDGTFDVVNGYSGANQILTVDELSGAGSITKNWGNTPHVLVENHDKWFGTIAEGLDIKLSLAKDTRSDPEYIYTLERIKELVVAKAEIVPVTNGVTADQLAKIGLKLDENGKIVKAESTPEATEADTKKVLAAVLDAAMAKQTSATVAVTTGSYAVKAAATIDALPETAADADYVGTDGTSVTLPVPEITGEGSSGFFKVFAK